MTLAENFRLVVNRIYRKMYSKKRNKELNNKNFTIISNNCWGGMVYVSYNLRKNSPTVGLFFMPDDYIRFISNMKFYLNLELRFIDAAESKNKDKLRKTLEFGHYPIGVLGDIEIYFMHYKSENEALDKWNRRCKRINFNNIIYKFCDQNGCTKKDIDNFLKLPYKNKLFFTVRKWNINSNCIIYFKQIFNKKYINNSNEPFGHDKDIDITNYLNSIEKDR